MKKKVKLYEVREDSLVYCISFVENPAIESEFIYLSSDEPIHQIYLEQDEKHIVYGAVLIPNKPIYRRCANEEFYIKFPQSSIEQLAHNYLIDGNNKSFTEHHQFNVEDVSIVESWVKLSEADKSVDLGLNVPNGSWVVGVKVNNNDLWNDIKEGKVKGFSVESFLNFDEIMLNKIEDTNMDEVKETIEVSESFWMRIATIIKEALKNPEVPELEAQVTAAQVVDDMKEDVVIEEATEVIEEPLTDEEPIVEETTEPEVIAEEVVTEVVEETSTTDEAKEDLQIVIDELNKKIAELNSKIEELEKENVKLSKQPSAKPINIKANLSSDSSAFDRMLAVMNGSAFSK